MGGQAGEGGTGVDARFKGEFRGGSWTELRVGLVLRAGLVRIGEFELSGKVLNWFEATSPIREVVFDAGSTG